MKPIKAGSLKKTKFTMAATARKMILAGKSNKQVYAALKLIYKLDESKKWYAAWYRGELRRKGLLTAEG